jgi:tetratricopeptide (TPR) repeat protein
LPLFGKKKDEAAAPAQSTFKYFDIKDRVAPEHKQKGDEFFQDILMEMIDYSMKNKCVSMAGEDSFFYVIVFLAKAKTDQQIKAAGQFMKDTAKKVYNIDDPSFTRLMVSEHYKEFSQEDWLEKKGIKKLVLSDEVVIAYFFNLEKIFEVGKKFFASKGIQMVYDPKVIGQHGMVDLILPSGQKVQHYVTKTIVEMAATGYHWMYCVTKWAMMVNALQGMFGQSGPKQPQTAPKMMEEGKRLMREGKVAQAGEQFEKAVGAEPKNFETWYNKGVYLILLGRSEESMKCFAKSVELNPKWTAGWTNMGKALYNLKQYEKALTMLDKSLTLDPKDPTTWYIKGQVYAVQSRYKEAIPLFNKAIELDPKNPDPWHAKGLVYERQEQPKVALGCYIKALEIDPNHKEAIIEMGVNYSKGGAHAEAMKCIDRGLSIYPNDPDLWMAKAAAFRGMGREDEAVDCMRRAKGHQK